VETALGRQRLRGEVHDGDTALVDYDAKQGALAFTPKAAISRTDPAADGGEARDTEAAEEEPVEATSVA
jgi:hypothetical protein